VLLIRAFRGELDAVDLIEEADQFLEPLGSDRLHELGVLRQFFGRLGTPGRSILDSHYLANGIRKRDQPFARRGIGPILECEITPIEASSPATQPAPEKPAEEDTAQN
jgi:hypothetical protein